MVADFLAVRIDHQYPEIVHAAVLSKLFGDRCGARHCVLRGGGLRARFVSVQTFGFGHMDEVSHSRTRSRDEWQAPAVRS
jgi:hypothetical protein